MHRQTPDISDHEGYEQVNQARRILAIGLGNEKKKPRTRTISTQTNEIKVEFHIDFVVILIIGLCATSLVVNVATFFSTRSNVQANTEKIVNMSQNVSRIEELMISTSKISKAIQEELKVGTLESKVLNLKIETAISATNMTKYESSAINEKLVIIKEKFAILEYEMKKLKQSTCSIFKPNE